MRALLHEGGDDETEFTRGAAGAAVLLMELRRIHAQLERLEKVWTS